MNKKLSNILEGMGGVVVMVFAVATPFLRRWRTRWGATGEEVNASLPGDNIIGEPKWQYTQAITIAVPIERVWPRAPWPPTAG